MADPWSYTGKRVVVIGCYSGIGEAAARELVRLGAEVHGVDYRASDQPLASFALCDLRKTEAIDAALAALPDDIDALFYCAGLPQTSPGIEIIQVNFLSARYLVERALPKMAPASSVTVIASTAGNGYPQRIDTCLALATTPDYDAGLAWAEPRLNDLGDLYMFSKEVVIVWGFRESSRLIGRGIRLNLLSPGPTFSGMTKDFEAVSSAAIIDVYTQPLGRRASPEEQALPLIFLGSDAASYVNGCNFIADAGFTAGMITGQIDLERLLAEARAA